MSGKTTHDLQVMGMRLTIQCPACQHTFFLDSAFQGMMRKCPSCETKFEVNDDVVTETAQSTLGQPKAEAPMGGGSMTEKTVVMEKQPDAKEECLPAVQVACHSCFRDFPVRARDDEEQTCQFCSATFTTAEGRQFLEVHEKARDACWESLLNGNEHDSVDSLLPAFGLNETAAKEVKRRAIRDLPFARFKIREEGGPAIPRATNCDICSKALTSGEKTVAFDAEWSKEHQDRATDGLSLAGDAFTGSKTYNVTKFSREAIYCLCETCQKAFMGKSFFFIRFSSYKGYPATQDWDLTRFKKKPAEKLLG